MHGSLVNFAARLMCCKLIKYTGGILIDTNTLQLCTGKSEAQLQVELMGGVIQVRAPPS